MRCPPPQELRDLARGAGAGDVEELGAHVADCPECRAFLRGLGETSRAIVAEATTVPAPDPDPSSSRDRGGPPGTTLDRDPDATVTRSDLSRTTDAEPATAGRADAVVEVGAEVGRYRIVRRLGQGAFGAVYLAHDPQLDRMVAIKLTHPSRLRAPGDVERYLNEARMLAALDHPHVLPVFDAGGGRDGPCYVVTKYVDGTNLASLMHDAPPSLAEAAALVARVAEGLDHAHSSGLVHRDIKPANILIAADGHPYLADFGLAFRDSPDEPAEFAGTPEYMSPEQIRCEGHRIDGRSDIYSLGVVFYRLLTGCTPHQAASTQDLLARVIHETIAPPREVNPAVPPELDRICRKMLEKRSADRYQSAAELVDDLAAWDRAEESRAAPGPVVAGPRGLRRFDAGDAGAFLDLLPGPRDRDGLPESVAFWKRRIESIDPGTFRVGLLLGPSGGGKSSLVAAGLLPRLARHVVAVVVDASRGTAMPQAMAAVRSAFPGLPVGIDLRTAMADLRTATAPGARGRKLLLVLDQFEQCLAAGEELPGLAEALRQCDGARVQALLIVRDDFALAASRFFDDLEEPLAQGGNFAAVDRFTVEHARGVLVAFGRALGRIAPAPEPPTPAQMAFIDGALGELADSGEVAPIRLAVLVEMVRERPWEPGSLREVGGVEGLGVAFLEGLFASTSAHPRLRALAGPARDVLRALLPPPGSTIRGGARTIDELRREAGSELDPAAFDELIALLDREARLITPVGEGPDGAPAAEGPPRYGLAHDYLVPSLRSWLALKQRETARGRAEWLLAERAAGWSLDPSPRQLPTAVELATILLRTRPDARTDRERAMLRAAARFHGARAAVAAAILAVAALFGLGAWRALEGRRLDAEARGLAARLTVAAPGGVPAILGEIDRRRARVEPILDAAIRRSAPGGPGRRRAALGLLGAHPDLTGLLVEEVLRPDLDLDEARLIAGALGPVAGRAIPALWQAAEGARPEVRLRAAMALAALDSGSDRWRPIAPIVASALLDRLAADPARFGLLVEAFRPARSALVGPLIDVLRSGRREAAPLVTGILLDYAKDDPPALAQFLGEVEPSRISEVAALIRPHGEAAISLLERRLSETIEPEPWPVPSGLPDPDPLAVAAVEKAAGRIEPGSAHVLALPLSELESLADRLGAAGYRPVRIRPYRGAAGISVAALWARDARPWRLAIGPGPDEYEARRAALAREGFEPVDLAAYPSEAPGRPGWKLAAAWAAAQPGAPERRTTLDPDDAGFLKAVERLEADHFDQETHHILELDHGARRVHAAVWVKAEASRPIRARRFDGSAGDYGGDLYPGAAQLDVSLGVTDRPKDLARRMEAKLAATEAKLRDNPRDPNLRFDRGYAHFYLGHDDEALADWDALIREFPAYAWMWKMPRTVLSIRRGDLDRARADLRDYLAHSKDEGKNVGLKAYLRAREGDPAGAADGLAREAAAHASDPSFLYAASNGMSRIAGLAAANHLPDAGRYVERAVGLLEAAVKAGHKITPAVRDDPDFEPINRSPGFIALVGRGRLGDRYTALWRPAADVESIELHGLDPDEHGARSRELASRGYRPVAIGAFRSSSGGRTLAASVWQRRTVPSPARVRLAGRKANVAAGLIVLGRPERAWPLLNADADSLLAESVLDRLTPAGITPETLAGRLAAERDPGARMTLILALGRWPADGLTPDRRRPIADRLARLFETDPDPGVHSAAEWTLKRWEPLAWPSIARRAEGRAPRAGFGWSTGREGDTFLIAGPATFLMGLRPGEAEPSPWIREDLHRCEVPRRFAIATKEVTNAQFARFLDQAPAFKATYRGRNDYSPDPDGPATHVSFPTAVAYCRWLTAREGLPESQQCYDEIASAADAITLRQGYLARHGYRLPTEAEWELTGRAGLAGPDFVGGSSAALPAHAWFAANAVIPGIPTGRTHPTGLLLPNRWGAFDILGNAMEWTSGRGDLYPTPEPGKAAVDREHLGPLGRDDYLVARGASFAYSAGNVRLSMRTRVAVMRVSQDLGFRVARTLPDR